MKKFVSPLKLKDIISLIALIAIGFGWILIDQIFLHESYQRFIAFYTLVIILYFLQFKINKPKNVFHYANTLAIISVLFAVLASVIIHIIINHDFSSKSVFIWIALGILPYIIGIIYSKTRKRKT